jgi:hypothetical protein
MTTMGDADREAARRFESSREAGRGGERHDPALTAALRALADEDAASMDVGASPAVSARLLAEVHAIAAAHRRHQRNTGLAVAATLVMAAALLVMWHKASQGTRPGGTTAGVQTSARAGAGAAAGPVGAGTTGAFGGAAGGAGEAQSAGTGQSVGEVATAFLPLAYSAVPVGDAQIVRMQLPRAALRSFGLAPADLLDGSAATGTVPADVLVGEDGLARAVRFIRVTKRSSQIQEHTP